MRFKKIIYIIASSILGLLMAILAYSLLEIWHIDLFLSAESVPPENSLFGYSLYFPPLIFIGFLLIGFLGGLFLGETAWNKYLEKQFREKH